MKKPWMILAATAGFLFSAYWAWTSTAQPPVARPLSEPPQTKSARTLAGAGIVEAAGRNLVLAPPVAGQVAEVFVHENEKVPAGAPLYRFTPPDFPVYVGQQVDVFIDLGSQ